MPKESFRPRMIDEAVEAKTGKACSRWLKHLDAAGRALDLLKALIE